MFNIAEVLYSKFPSKEPESSWLLNCVKRTEKETFPTAEVFHFDSELAKRTTSFYCAYIHSPGSTPPYQLCGYIVYLRTKVLTRIHKVCVVERHRRQGIGKFMMQKVIEDLKRSRASQVDLWVDEERKPARALYKACGFMEQETVKNYYGNGRTGIRMKLELSDVRCIAPRPWKHKQKEHSMD